jgi:hypothetical protein
MAESPFFYSALECCPCAPYSIRPSARKRGLSQYSFSMVANAIFGVVSVLVIADRTGGTGRFNLVQGALATAVGLGAALSTTFGGRLIHQGNYDASFFALGGVAAVALALLWFVMPETLVRPIPVPSLSQEQPA